MLTRLVLHSFLLFSSLIVAVVRRKEFIDGVRSMYQLKNIRTPAGWMMIGMLDVNIDIAYLVCLV